MTLAQQIEYIKQVFGNLETLPVESANKLLDLLDKAPDKALEMIIDADIKFCVAPAKRRLEQRKAKAL